MSALSSDDFKTALPDKLKKSINKEVIDKVNLLLADPDMHEQYRENLISYTAVMKDGKFKLTSYVDAVKYVSQKLMDKTNFAAFSATFPDKIKDWTARGVESKDMASYVSSYNKSKLVNLILEQTLTPCWILNQDMYQRALNTQAVLMTDANSEKVRSDAANSILTHLKQPESQKIELSVSQKTDSSIDALRESTMDLVAQQKQAIKSGFMSAQEIAHSRITVDNDSGEADT
jgi:hypothetical protein